MKIYADKDTGYFKTISETVIEDDTFLEVPSLPPNANYRWDGNDWIPLTSVEIASSDPEYDSAQDDEKSVTTPNKTTIGQLAYFGNTTGDLLEESIARVTAQGDLVGRYLAGTGLVINNVFATVSNFITGTPAAGHIPYFDGRWRSRSLSELQNEFQSQTQKRTWCWSMAINKHDIKNNFLRRQNGTETSHCPYIAIEDARIYALSLDNQPTEDDGWRLEIFVNGTLFHSFLKPSGSTASRIFEHLNLVLKKGDRLSAKCVQAGKDKIAYPGTSLYLESR